MISCWPLGIFAGNDSYNIANSRTNGSKCSYKRLDSVDVTVKVKAAIAEVFAKEEEMYETAEPRAQKLSAQLKKSQSICQIRRTA